MAKLRLALAAQQDIRSIRAYSKAAFGAKTTMHYLEGLRATLKLLSDRPRLGATEADLGETMRGFAYRSHRIFYRVDGEDVLIVRILHHARDAASILSRAP